MATIDEMRASMFPQPTGFGATLEDPVFNMGMGLLAAGQGGAQPSGWGQGLLGASQFAAERQNQTVQNNLRRQALGQAQQEQAGQAAMTQFMSENPDATPEMIKAKALEFMPGPSSKAMLASMFDPSLRAQAEALRLKNESADLGNQKAARELAVEKRAAKTDYQQLVGLNKALDFIADRPLAQRMLNSPGMTAAATSGLSEDDLIGELTSQFGSVLTGMDKAEQQRTLNVVAYALKTQANIALGSSAAVGAQARAEKGLGQGFAIPVQRKIGGQLQQQAEEYISSVPGWELPDYSSEKYPWEIGTSDGKKGAIEPQLPRVKKKPNTAKPPADRDVPVSSAATPKYAAEPSTDEITRLIKAGVTSVEIGGEVYDLKP